MPAVRPLLECMEVNLSDIEDGDNEEKTATVERKVISLLICAFLLLFAIR